MIAMARDDAIHAAVDHETLHAIAGLAADRDRTPFGETAEAVARLARHACGARLAALTRLDRRGRNLEVVAVAGDLPGLALQPGFAAPPGALVCSMLYGDAAGAPLTVSDLWADPRAAGDPHLGAAPAGRAFAGAPVLLPSGVPYGAICVLDDHPRHFAPEALDALSLLATVAGLRAWRSDGAAEGETAAEPRDRVLRLACLPETSVRDAGPRPADAPDGTGRSFTSIADGDMLQAILDAIPATVYIKDVDKRILRINRAAAAVVGLADPADAIGKRTTDLVGPELGARLEADDDAVLESGRVIADELTGPDLIDGTERTYLYTKAPIRDASGEIVGLVTNSLDITRRKAAEAALAAALADQQAANAELERTNRAQAGFISMVSHEFRTPLTAIQGYADLIADFPLTPDEVREYAAEIGRGATRLARLTNDILELDRIRRAHVRLEPVELRLDALLREVTSALRPSAHDHPISLDCGAGDPVVTGDPDRLTQVFTNLIANAMKYSASGRPVEVRCAVVADRAVVSVRDHGYGIPADALESIFEPYTRLPNPDGCAAVGSGLGLSIARELVELHGGTLRAARAGDDGSVFTVSLPLAGAVA